MRICDFFVILIIASLLLAGCSSNLNTDIGSSIPSVGDYQLPENSGSEQYAIEPDAIIKTLNKVLVDGGYADIRYSFDSNLICDDYESMTIYRTYKWMRININENIIVVYMKDSGEYKVIDLGDYSGLRISYIRPMPNPNLLRIDFQDGVFNVGMGYFFNNLISTIFYSLPEQQIVKKEYAPCYDVCGMVGTKDLQQFDNCTVNGKTATFRFRHIPTDNFGVDGPEIVLRLSDESGESAVFGFRNTELNLSQEFVRQVQSLEGVFSAEFEHMETGLFTGTQLSIIPAQDYKVSCSFNQGSGINTFDDFNVFCVRTVYARPDFSDALGFKLDLPSDMGASEISLYSGDIANIQFQLDETLTANLYVSEDIGAGVYVSPYEDASYASVDNIRVQFVEDKNTYLTTNGKFANWVKDGYTFSLKYGNSEIDFPMQSFQAFAERLVREVVVIDAPRYHN